MRTIEEYLTCDMKVFYKRKNDLLYYTFLSFIPQKILLYLICTFLVIYCH